ncbi:MAG: hypothetical protein ABI207_06525 [Crocinitomicaceae bacterium]
MVLLKEKLYTKNGELVEGKLYKGVKSNNKCKKCKVSYEKKKIMNLDIWEEMCKSKKAKKASKKNVSETEEKPKKVNKKRKVEIKLDSSIVSDDFEVLNELELYSSELVSVFGQPIQVDAEDYNYEYKVRVGDSEYSICDDNNECEFKDITWYLSGNDNKGVKKLMEYIKEQVEV